MAWCGSNQADRKTIKVIVSCRGLEYGECQNITQNIASSQYPSHVMRKSPEVPDIFKQTCCICKVWEDIKTVNMHFSSKLIKRERQAKYFQRAMLGGKQLNRCNID